MPTVQVKAQLSSDDLLYAAKHLNSSKEEVRWKGSGKKIIQVNVYGK